jgi:hypothetical protein
MTKEATALAPDNLTKDDAVELSERSLSRLIAESDVYDFKPTARSLLREIAMMTMDGSEYDVYPGDAPPSHKADRKGWCWMSQWRLGLRVGISESQINRLIDMFHEHGVLEKRYWHDSRGALHAEYKLNRDVFISHQRPSQTEDVERPSRYSKERPKKGWFSSTNQPKRDNPAAEMDEE